MLKRIFLQPPLAFARVGSASTPCENFYWGPDDLTPGGTARTRIVGDETLVVNEKDGTVTVRPPRKTVIFKDKEGFRPVCPFFELHGVWECNGKPVAGPLTKTRLQKLGLSEKELTWQVEIANLKAFHFTCSSGDRVWASVDVPAENYSRHRLEGTSLGRNKLVPEGKHIPLGSVQATCPTDAVPEFRLRFTPPAGRVYAPTNLPQRLQNLERPKKAEENFEKALEALGTEGAETMLDNFLLSINEVWRNFELPAEQCLLNPDARWAKYKLIGADHLLAKAATFLPRLADLYALRGRGDRSELIRAMLGPGVDAGNLPPSVFAFVAEKPHYVASLGMIDDMGDGTVSVRLGKCTARSRIVIAPPSFAPDRRLPVSIADGLMDRVDRDSVRKIDWEEEASRRYASNEVADLLDRAYETAGLQNADAVADFFREENRNLAWRRGSGFTEEQAADQLWDDTKLTSVMNQPLTAVAMQRHRRNTTRLLFEAYARETEGWFETHVRPPVEPKRLYDRRMPALMRGSDRYPLHLTRRQYELLAAWSKQWRKS